MIEKLILDISLMLSLTMLVLSSVNVGLLGVITRPLNKFTKNKTILTFWFILSCLMTGLVADTSTAIILVPLAILYAEQRGIDKIDMLISVVFGSVVGNDLTYLGGGDTVLAWNVLRKFSQHPLTLMDWGNLFWMPTLLGMLVCGLWLWFRVFKDIEIKAYAFENNTTHSIRFYLTSLIFTLGLIIAFIPKLQYYTIGFALLSVIVAGIKWKDLKKLPYKAFYMWSGAYLVGNYISQFIKAHYHFVVPAYAYTFYGIFVVIVIVAVMTNFITNTGLSAILIPIIMTTPFIDKLWLFVIVVKCIDLSFLTALANGCLTVGSSYGLTHKRMFRDGLPILVIQIVVFALYFLIMRGRIIL